MPLLTITPASMTNPIMAMTLTSLPLTYSPRKPPVKARGMVNIMINGDSRDWNWATMIRYMNSTAKISISTICSMAS